ncbi:uncharacterized protein PG986_010159 [Apiospora aurea]|uniref:Uncharacterized protein n=1 Tax=Apiospora aurea TaxID=335848 RepID=A0ABR1QA38_9PEZI
MVSPGPPMRFTTQGDKVSYFLTYLEAHAVHIVFAFVRESMIVGFRSSCLLQRFLQGGCVKSGPGMAGPQLGPDDNMAIFAKHSGPQRGVGIRVDQVPPIFLHQSSLDGVFARGTIPGDWVLPKY